MKLKDSLKKRQSCRIAKSTEIKSNYVQTKNYINNHNRHSYHSSPFFNWPTAKSAARAANAI
ncbi:hypothetical protein BH20BAC1_BH20BAC1_09730 [soil metagenome]